MLSAADNETITRVGRGTPMGEVFRRFWLPVMASDDLPERDGSPVRLRILGEDLVGFRDTNGAVGLLEAACPHRRAKLFWGRNEDCGLRCAYHGWKFDVAGQCVDMPSEPADSTFKERIRARSYPATERAGLIWAYLGERGTEPEFPRFDFLDPACEATGSSWFQRSNWLQSLEGDIDTAHVSFLHRPLDTERATPPPQFIKGFPRYVAMDTAPFLAVKETPYGFLYGGRRTVGDGEYYWRMSHWIAPAGAQVPGTPRYRGMRFLTPIDDYHSVSCSLRWHDPDATTDDALSRIVGATAPLVAHTLPDGYIIDVRKLERGPENDYLIDRDVQRSTTFSGIPGGPRDQDRAVTETMEPILDRSEEHLGTTDTAIIALRRRLLSLARDLERGIEPPMASDPAAVRGFRGFDLLTRHADLGDVLAEWSGELVGGG
ncbi:MAG: Rieske 2Fe-2S domain-containing protein [Acidimicrobiales bacterium]|nr:Rieske 2Fe-2S domain-containing protein [Acidimicrobiales bacterium]